MVSPAPLESWPSRDWIMERGKRGDRLRHVLLDEALNGDSHILVFDLARGEVHIDLFQRFVDPPPPFRILPVTMKKVCHGENEFQLLSGQHDISFVNAIGGVLDHSRPPTLQELRAGRL